MIGAIRLRKADIFDFAGQGALLKCWGISCGQKLRVVGIPLPPIVV
jgi:hypothetical protein